VDLDYTVKGDLTGPKKTARTCDTFSGETPDKYGFWQTINTDDRADCTDAHNAEFVGVFDVPATPTEPADTDKVMDTYWNHCEALTSAYIGQTVKALDARLDVQTYWFWPSDKLWADGEHSVQCYLATLPAKTIKTSLKGHGAAAIG
jgi:hypothetical protein